MRTLLFGFLLLLFATLPGPARAQQFGGCFERAIGPSLLCAGPSATLSVGVYNATTGKFSGGVVPGLGYGLTYAADQWYALGLAGYLSFSVGQGQPNEAIPIIMASFANYVRVGIGMKITEQEAGGPDRQWLVFFGFGSDFGASTRYLKEALVPE